MPQNETRVPSAVAAAVMGALYAHPEEDTPSAITEVIADPEVDVHAVVEALRALRDRGLVQTDGGHWQLTAAPHPVAA